jgi:hypothetical protein
LKAGLLLANQQIAGSANLKFGHFVIEKEPAGLQITKLQNYQITQLSAAPGLKSQIQIPNSPIPSVSLW